MVLREGGEGVNILDYARSLFPNATEEYIDFILWNRTCFPFDNERAAEQLREIAGIPCGRCGK